MKSDEVPHNNFDEGYKVGYQLIHGINVTIPGIHGHPGYPGTTTLFLEGIKAGIKAAGGSLAI
jgi:hypothetical protein